MGKRKTHWQYELNAIWHRGYQRLNLHCRESSAHPQTRKSLLKSQPTERSGWLQSVMSAAVTVRVRTPSLWDSDITAIRALKESWGVRQTASPFKVYSCQLLDGRLEMLQLDLSERLPLLLTLPDCCRTGWKEHSGFSRVHAAAGDSVDKNGVSQEK